LSDNQSSLIRRAKATAIQRKLRAGEIRQVRAVFRKMMRAESEGTPLTLWPTDLSMLRRAAQRGLSDRTRRKVGAPALTLLTRFARWIAIDALFTRAGSAIKAKVANSHVAERWQVSQRTVEASLSKHRSAAEKFLAIYAPAPDIEVLIAQQAEAFRVLFLTQLIPELASVDV
jgi:hypothetical protein